MFSQKTNGTNILWPQTGIDKATPAGKIMRQYFEHFGFNVLGEWYVLSKFHGGEDKSTQGMLGDICGKPTTDELENIKKDAHR